MGFLCCHMQVLLKIVLLRDADRPALFPSKVLLSLVQIHQKIFIMVLLYRKNGRKSAKFVASEETGCLNKIMA